MITLLFWGLFLIPLSLIDTFLPIAPALPIQITASILKLNGLLGLFSDLFPWGTVLSVFFAILYFEAAFWAFKWLNWIFNKIRGSG